MFSPFLLAAALAAPPESLCSHPLVRLDQDGREQYGTKAAVLSAFRAGLPLRVSWSLDGDGDGSPDVSHWADSGFLTEFEGNVFAQLHDIQRQQPRRGEGRIELPRGGLRWTGLLGTNGVLESHFDDGSDPSTHRVASEWCVDERASACAIPAWRLVYRHDADGQAMEGTKEALFDSVRRGYPLRIAWGFEGSVEGERSKSNIPRSPCS